MLPTEQLAADAQRHVSRRRKSGAGVAQGRDAAMEIRIHVNVFRLLNDDTVSSIQRSCTQGSLLESGPEKKALATELTLLSLSHSPEDNGPTLWTMHAFHIVLFSLKTLGRGNPEKARSNRTHEDALTRRKVPSSDNADIVEV